MMGLAYGLRNGADAGLAYNEARGLFVGTAAFMLASRSLPADPLRLPRPLFVAEALLAAIVLIRYFIWVRAGLTDVPVEFAFAHEGSVILGIGFVAGLAALVETGRSLKRILWLVAYCLLVTVALL